jgi:hypothetical protein
MLWLKEHHPIFQAIALLLFCAAILGPWGISADGVPPADWCSAPYILLREDRCVRLTPGIELLGIGGVLLFSVPFAVLTGESLPWILSARCSLFALFCCLSCLCSAH